MWFELAKVERLNLGLSAGAVAASLALATPHFATSLAAGAALEALNLGALRRSAVRFFAGELTRSWTGAFALRFLVLAVGIFLTLQAGAHPVALLIGLSLAMPAVLIDAWLNRPPILDPATLPILLDEDADEASEAMFGDELGSETRAANDETGREASWSWTGSLFRTRLLPPGGALDSNVPPSPPSPPSPHSPLSPLTDAEPSADETRR